MSTSHHFTVQVGDGTSGWHDLPIGTYIEGFAHSKKKRIRMFPLGHGGVNVADRKYMPAELIVVVEVFENSMDDAAAVVTDTLALLEAHEEDDIQLYDEVDGVSAYLWQYDEVNDYEVTFAQYAKGVFVTARFTLDLLEKPYLYGTVS